MKKKYLLISCLFFLLIFVNCSVEKETVLDGKDQIILDGKDQIIVDSTTNVKPIDMLPDFTLLEKNHVPDSDLYIEGGILQNQTSNPKFMLSGRKFQGMPSIGKDKLGNLYVAWIASSGCAGECDDNYLTISISKDKGITWSHDKLILFANPEDSTRMKDPNFFNDKFGNLYLYWGKHVQKKEIREWAITWYSKLDLSDDGNTINYSPPRRIAEGIMLNKLFYSSISDEVIFPIARWYLGNYELHKPFIYKANYGDRSLVNFRKTGAIPVPVAISNIYEHMIVQLKDNTYLGMVRTTNGVYYSKSIDGNLWEDAKKFTALGPTTASRFYLGKLKSGRLILIFNNDTNRSYLTVCLSEDDGLTWPYKMLLDDTKEIKDIFNGGYGVSYPDMIETDSGVLNIVYDYLRSPVGGIVFIKIKEEDIIKKNSEFFKSEISSFK